MKMLILLISNNITLKNKAQQCEMGGSFLPAINIFMTYSRNSM